jgi:hypothetical protein
LKPRPKSPIESHLVTVVVWGPIEILLKNFYRCPLAVGSPK